MASAMASQLVAEVIEEATNRVEGYFPSFFKPKPMAEAMSGATRKTLKTFLVVRTKKTHLEESKVARSLP